MGKLSIKEHIQLGNKMKTIYEELLCIHALVSRLYGKTSIVSKRAQKAHNFVSLLCSGLDDIVLSEYPNYDEGTLIYYGQERFNEKDITIQDLEDLIERAEKAKLRK